MAYITGDKVRFLYPRCACVGGGTSTLEGIIVGVLRNGEWFQIDQPNGTVVVKHEHILEIIPS